MGKKKSTIKLIIFTAPSGAGKTTIVRHLLKTYDQLAFSVSATTRARRPHEVDGKDYYFLTSKKFKTLVKEGAFVEWEEVYEDQYYGTLKSEIERISKKGKYIVFDVEVKGATNIKKFYEEEAYAVFIKPPSVKILMDRLKNRKNRNRQKPQKKNGQSKRRVKI